jgi:hypothetical protein
MSPDDQIRRALSAATPPVTAHAALREMRPSMQRARIRRRVAMSATAAALLVGGGAGVFALTASQDETTLRSVTSDQNGQPLPTVTEVVVSSTTVSTTVAGLDESASMTELPTATPTSTASEDGGGVPTDDGEAPVPAVEMPPPAAALPATPVPAEPPAPVSPPPASFQTITSACGDVVVSINAGTVQIVTITSRPGFDQSVSDDGPNSIEMTFSGEGDVKCELHAEMKSGELDVEVQNSEAER